MNTSNIIIAHPVSQEKLESLKAFLKELKIKFEIAKEQPYTEDFVKMIQKGDEDFKKGNFTRVEKNELKNFLGLE